MSTTTLAAIMQLQCSCRRYLRAVRVFGVKQDIMALRHDKTDETHISRHMDMECILLSANC